MVRAAGEGQGDDGATITDWTDKTGGVHDSSKRQGEYRRELMCRFTVADLQQQRWKNDACLGVILLECRVGTFAGRRRRPHNVEL